MAFELLAAIDIRQGRVVRLRQGDFDLETVFSSSPIETARRMAGEGARWLHVVDLDAAKGETPQTRLIAGLITALPDVDWQIGGGLRTEQAVADMFSAGASRVVAGTALLNDPDFARAICSHHGADRIVAALDIRDGRAVGEGWRTGAVGREFESAVEMLVAAGYGQFAVTAIDRDGLLGGPDLQLLGHAVALSGGSVIASGGIRSIDDLRTVRAAGCSGAIVGRAIYEGRLTIADAMAAIASEFETSATRDEKASDTGPPVRATSASAEPARD